MAKQSIVDYAKGNLGTMNVPEQKETIRKSGRILDSNKPTINPSAIKNYAKQNIQDFGIGNTNGLKTLYQQNLEQNTEDNWYKGDMPTTREIYGRIYDISQTDPETAKTIAAGFSEAQKDPTSPWYSKYGVATSNSIKYEGQTQKAEQEWAALQQEINYWTGRTDLNLSDDEIYQKVHGEKFASKYPTLAKMDDVNSTVNLNRVIGYSDDNMYTAIWRARGNKSTGSWEADTALSAAGVGNFWQENPEINPQARIGTPECNRYALGMTLEEEGLYFNVPEFTRETLDRINAELTATGWSDPVATKNYRSAEAAYETTEKLNSDVKTLYEDIDALLPYYDADTIISMIREDSAYKDLFYLDKTMEGKADLVKTTGPVNYRWADVEQYIRDKKTPDGITGTSFTNDLVNPVTPEETITEEPVTQQPAPQEPTSQEPVPETTGEGVDYVGASLSFLGGLLRNWIGGNNEAQNESIPEPQGTQPPASSVEPTPKPKNTPAPPPQDETDAALEEEDKRNRDNTGAAVYQEGTPEEQLVFRTANAGNFGTMSDTVSGAKLTPEQARAKREKNLNDDTLSRTYTDGFRKILQYEEEKANLESTENDLSFMNSIVGELQKVMDGETPSETLLEWLPDEYKDKFIVYSSVLHRIEDLENKAAEGEEIEGYNVREAIQNIENDYQAQMLNDAFNSLQEGNSARMEADGPHDNLMDIYQGITGQYVDPASEEYNEAMRIGQAFYDYLSSTGGIGEDETDELRELEAKKAEAESIFRAYKEEAAKLEKAVANSKGILSTMQGDYDESIAMRNDLHNMWESYGEDYEDADTSLQETVEATISAATRYNAPQYLTNTYWHSMVEAGNMTQEEAISDAKKFVNGYGDYIKKIEKGLELDKTKHFLTDQERQKAENNKKVLEDQLAAAGDFLAMSNINIDEKAQEAMDKGVTDDISDLTKSNVNALLNGIADENVFEFIWNSITTALTGEDEFSKQFLEHYSHNTSDVMYNKSDIKQMIGLINDDEKKLYFYYLATEGEDAANAYFQRLVNPQNGIVKVRNSEEESKKLQEQAGNLAGWGLSFLSKVIGDYQAGVGNVFNAITGQEDSPYGNQYIGMQATQDIRQGFMQNVKGTLGGLNEDGTNNGWGDTIDFVLNGATSAIDSLINSVGTSAAYDIIGEAIPIVGKVMGLLESASEGSNIFAKFGAKFLQDMTHAMPMAFGAALQTVREWKIKGADPDQLKGIFAATLFAESISEALSYENIKGAFENGQAGLVKNFITEYFGGGLNEALGEAFNQWWENNAETTIMKDMSQYSQIVSYYHDELHMPMSVAEEMASQEMTKSIIMAAAEGFFSSSLSQTASFVTGYIREGRYNTAVSQYNKSSLAILSGLGMKGSRISGKNNTTASAAISGVLRAGTGDVEGSKAASTHLVNDYGIDATTSMMRGIISEAGNYSPKASAALNFGALTNGKTSEAVQKMAAKAQNGEKITSRDVSDMLDAFDEEQGDETLNTMYKQAVKGNKIASETLTNLANPVSAKNIKDASDAVRKAEQTKEMRTSEKEEAQDKYDAVSKNADEAAQTSLDNPGDQENLGNLEQTMNQKAGAYRDVQQREAQEKVQEEKVKEEKEKAEQVNKEEMANARAQAKATVEQEEAEAQDAEEQQVQDAYAESVASNPPTDAFGQSIEIRDDNGNTVKVTGVYDQTDEGWVFTTEDGRLITVTNDLSHADPGIWDAMNKFEDRGHQPQNRPTAYMEQSIKGTTRNGEVILIGLAGVENNNGIPDPVFMGSDGQIYRLSDVRISNDDIDYAYDVVDSRTDLPVIKPQQQSDIQALNKKGSKQELEDTTPEFDTKVEQRRNQYVYNRGLKVAQEKYNLTGEQAEAYARSFLRGYQNRNTVDFSKPVSNREAKRLIYKMAKRLGLKVVYEDMPDGYDGHYADGVVTLNKNIPVGQALMRIAGHEFTHSLEQTKSYEAFSNFVQEYLFKDEAAKEQAIQDMITKYKGYKVNLTEEQALKEIVADFTMNNLANKDVVNRLIDRGLGGRIRSILQKITSLFKGQNLSPEQKAQLNKLREAEALFKQAMQDRMNKALAEITPEQQAEADQAIRDAIANPVKQFSLGNTVEMREDGLMAVHNLSVRSLWSILKMGGIPMPSIAVKKKGSFWSDYGEISIFFGREAVDPFYGNVVYTGDAMTPTFGSATINTAEEGLEYLKKQPARDYMSLGTLTALFNGYKRVRSLNEMRANAYREKISPEDKKIQDELVSNMTERFKYAFEYQGNVSPAQFNALKYMTPINRGIFEAYEELEEMNADGGMTDDQIRAYYADSIKHNLRIAGLKDDIDFESRPGLIDSAIKACDFIVDHIASDTKDWDMQEAKTPEILYLDKDVQAILLPSTVPSDIIDALKDAGVSPDRIRYYEGKSTGVNRHEVMKAITEQIPGVAFSTGNTNLYDDLNEFTQEGVNGDQSGELASALGRTDGRTDNGVLESAPGQETAGSGTQSRPKYIRPDKSRVSERLLTPETRKVLEDKGATDLDLHEETDLQLFSDGLEEAKSSNSHGAYVDSQSVESLTEKGAITIMSSDGKAGVYIGTIGEEEGNIGGVYKSKSSRAANAVTSLIIQAVAQGGNKLDCFDGNLRNMYASVGMEPVARVLFNDDPEIMPKGWNTERDDHPDVVFWKLRKNETAESILEKFDKAPDEGGYPVYTAEDIQKLRLFEDVVNENGETEYGYNRAWAYRDSLIEEERKKTEGEAPIVDDIDKVGTAPSDNIIPNDEESVKLDEKYRDAVENGDLETATSLLMDKLKKTEGVIPFIAPHWDAGKDRDTARAIKDKIPEEVAKAAEGMKQYVPDNAVLIPMPGHTGKVTEDSDTMVLANALSELTGRPVVAALEGNDRESRAKAKKDNRKGASQEELGFRKVADIPEGTMPIFIDNIVGKGVTADAAREAMGGGITLAYTKTLRSPGIKGLKNAIVTYDTNRNLIPLSQRFDVTKRDVRYSVGNDQMDQDLRALSTDYQDAVSRGDMEAAQQDVESYAESKGYTDHGYHGSDFFGFTEFDLEESQGTIFISYDKDLATTYTRSDDVKAITEGKLDTASPETLTNLARLAMEKAGNDGADVSYDAETGDFLITDEGETEIYSRDEIIDMLENFDIELSASSMDFSEETPIADELRAGIYDLYARPGKQLVIDGEGKPFGDTRVPWTDKPQTTREIAEWAKANGYDSVRINNIIDRGHNFNKMGLEGRDIGIFFNQNDVKSADTVTRDDNGNVIPLEERFSDDSDIRYSLGNNLTDADVQADLREAGLITDESVNSPVQALRVTRRQTPTQQQAAYANANYSPATIAKNLAKKLGIGDYIGTSKFGDVDAQAYFDRHSESAVVRTADAGDYTVTIHELGHAIAKMFNLTPTPEMMANFRRIAPSFFTTRGYTAAQLPGEAIAEFMWRYMEGEQQGRAFAGDAFYDSFEAAIRGTEAGEAIAEAREQLQTWINADTNAKIGTTIVNRSDKTNVPLRQRIQEGIDALVDNTSAAQNFDNTIEEITGRKSNVFDKVRQMALWANTAGKQATSILMGSGLTDAWGNVIGDSLADRFASVGFKAKGNNLDLLNRYMLALHSLDRDAQGKPVFDDHITPQERQAFIDDVRQNHPEVAAAEVQFQAFRREFLQEFLVNTGRLTQEAFDKMNSIYPHYVPTFRVKATDGIAQRTGKGKTYKIMRAKGSTENIYNPFDSFCGMVNTIVSQNALNRAGLAFDRMYQQNEGLGLFARLVPHDASASTNIDMTKKQQDVFNLVDGLISTSTMAELLRIVGGSGFTQENVNSFDTLKVVRPDGTIAEYQFNDMELFKLLAGVNNKTSNAALDALGFVTRGMSALTTGSNPIFAARNFMRDFQNSVNYGSWASNYGTGVMKWLAAAYQVWKESDDYKDYVALGGGGWTRIDPSRVASRNELYSGIFEGYETSNLGKTVKWAGKKVWNALTLARLNEIIEQTSRFAEYRYGKHDLTTEEGRLEGYLAGQEATVDFNRAGNSGLATMIKKLVPFFNASAQGVYRTTRMLTKAERERAPERFAKTVINTALLSALSTALLKGNMDDDDKKEFEMLSDDLKSKHFYLPNFAPDILGEAPLIRIPLAQDPLTYAIHGAVTNVLWSGDTEDGLMIDLGAIADTIVDNMNPIGSGTILAPILAINANKSWFGSRIVPSYLERNKYAPDQYTEETPEIFRTLGRMTNMSPLKLQYLAEQYTGFLGQLAIPALSKDSRGVLGGVNAAINAARKRFVSDPLTSNDVISSFYDGSDILNSVIEETNQGKPLNILRRGLTQEEAGQAYEDAKSLYSGLITDTKNKINALYTEIDNINENPSLSDHDKYELTSAKRRQMIELALTANEKIGEYKEKYITGKSVVMGMLTEGSASYKPTDVEKMSDTFKADIDNPDSLYMQRALSVYNGDQEGANKQASLPHPSYEFTLNTVNGEQDFVISEDERELYDNEYKRIYEQYVTGGYSNLKWSKKARQWDTLTSEERYNVLKNAATYANGKMKDLYVKNNHIQLRKD